MRGILLIFPGGERDVGPMHILIAPDKFKGSLSAEEAARAIQRGFEAALPEAECDLAPIADGGEGTAGIFLEALGGERVAVVARDALGRPVECSYAWLPKADAALVEMSAASGLWRLEIESLNPLRASTFGTGELMAHAIARGAKTLYLALGGSATNDAGLGMAAALGWKFLDAQGRSIEPVPEDFLKIRRIESPVREIPCAVIALCDVQNPLLGPEGATRVYGPQKGADAVMLDRLEGALAHVADLCRDQLGRDFRDVPGAGATGGLAFGLMTFCGARLEKGFAAVARILDLEARVAAADFVVTGEGRIDAQTGQGKGPAEVARLAHGYGLPVVAFAGRIEGEPPEFDACAPIADGPITPEESGREAGRLLESAARRVARLLKVGRRLA